MIYETIQTSKNDKIFTVSLNRPEVHNAMNDIMMKELTNCFKIISEDEEIKVVILTGNGKSFCAGADLNWMKSMANYSKDENIQDSKLLLNLYESIYNCKKPVIGKINGHAFGGGVGLVAVCDITVSLPEKKFAFSETKLGIIPSVISTYIVRRIGLFNMRRLFITGERFTSEYAEEIGLIDFITLDDEIDDFVKKYVNILLSSGPKSIIEIKNLVDNCQKMHVDDYKKFTVEKIAELRVSKEGQEGISAFLEKRKPNWSE
jgi:methylglutaconyl-CoA hydratase